MTDSLLITKYLAGLFPKLMPSAHQAEISRLLEELHGLNFFSLTFTGKTDMMKQTMEGEVQRRLQGEISQQYRDALEYKMKV